MKILILGGSGILGHHKLCQTLASLFDAYVTFRQTSAPYQRLGIFDETHMMDSVAAEDQNTVRNALATIRPGGVINCVGIVKQGVGAKDSLTSITVNSLFPHQLAKLCQDGLLEWFLSQDGRRGAYEASGGRSSAASRLSRLRK